MKQLSNMEIYEKENYCLISINPRVYPLDVIYSAAYVFLDKAYVLIDGEPNEEIIIELKPKEKYDLEKLGREFNNELLNYAMYKTQAEKNRRIREFIIQRALLTNEQGIDNEELEYIDDPKNIAVSWEEKYGKKTKK